MVSTWALIWIFCGFFCGIKVESAASDTFDVNAAPTFCTSSVKDGYRTTLCGPYGFQNASNYNRYQCTSGALVVSFSASISGGVLSALQIKCSDGSVYGTLPVLSWLGSEELSIPAVYTAFTAERVIGFRYSGRHSFLGSSDFAITYYSRDVEANCPLVGIEIAGSITSIKYIFRCPVCEANQLLDSRKLQCTTAPADQSLSIILISSMGSVGIMSLIAALWVCKRRRPRTKGDKPKQEIRQTRISKDKNSSISEITVVSNTTATANSLYTAISLGPTLVGNTSIMAIPGYLQVVKDKDYKLGDQIGGGGMSSVRLAKVISQALLEQSHSRVAAAKIFHLTHISDKLVDAFHQEVTVMNRFGKYQNICQLYGFDEENLTIIMKFYPDGSFYSYLRKKNNFWSKLLATGLSLDICNGLACLHHNQIAHCDLKSENILIDYSSGSTRMRAVLTDFGLARILTPEQLKVHHFRAVNVRGASLSYAAPEILLIIYRKNTDGTRVEDRRIAEEVTAGDIYAIGCILYEMITRHFMWNDRARAPAKQVNEKKDQSSPKLPGPPAGPPDLAPKNQGGAVSAKKLPLAPGSNEKLDSSEIRESKLQAIYEASLFSSFK